MFSNNKGISLLECMIAVFITTIAIVSIMPMQSTAIKTASRADYRSRAEGIMQSELEFRESQIMNVANPIPPDVNNVPITVSGLAGISGDATFYLTTITRVNPGVTNSWIVNVKVTWKENATGITSSIMVVPQMGFQ